MAVNAQTIITASYKDIGGLRPGMGMSSDVLADSLAQLNTLIDGWALMRDFIYEFNTPNWVVLVSFSDLTTTHVLAKGNQLALQKNLAVRIAPAMKIYWKIPEPLLEAVAGEAAAALTAIKGVGPS